MSTLSTDACFTEGGDSVLSVFSLEPLKRKGVAVQTWEKKKACSMRGSNLGLGVQVQGANPCS